MRSLCVLSILSSLPSLLVGCGDPMQQQQQPARPTPPDGSAPPDPHAITDENAKPGDDGWRIDDLGGDPAFAAYARPMSLSAGDTLSVQVAASKADTVAWAVYRMGWYGGKAARRVAGGDGVAVGPQPDPFIDPNTGLVECRWGKTFDVPVGADWLAGLYVVRLQLASGGARYAPFIVHDARQVDVLAVFPTATMASYNAWGGESLYSDSRFHFPVGHAYEVSYDRPFDDGAGAATLLTDTLPAVEYLEANGYDVSYLADHDVGAEPSPLSRARLVLSLGHDEYWTRTMRDHYEAARDGGVSLAFLGANTAYWQIRLEPAPDGMPERRQIGYKEAADLDPLRHSDDADVTGAFRGMVLNRPENGLLGIMSVEWHVVDFPWAVRGAGAWVYGGMGVSDGDLFPGVVGVESDGVVMNGAAPSDLQVVADSPTIGGDAVGLNRQQATVYATAAGGFVFAAGSIRFPATLAGPRGEVGSQRMLRNLIAKAGGTPLLPEDTVGASSGFASPDVSRAAKSVTTIAGGPGVAAWQDGEGASARFDSPAGLAVGPDGAIYVADAGNHRVRRVAPDGNHAVTTIAGGDTIDDVDGPGATARFHNPWGIAAAPDGTLYVSDPKGQRLRKIAPDGKVSTVAGPDTFLEPSGVAIGPDGTVYVTDLIDNSVRAFAGGAGPARVVMVSSAPDGMPSFPSGLAVDDKAIWMVDSGNRSVRRLDLASGTLTTVAGDSIGGFADGNGTSARLGPLLGIAPLGGSLVVADAGNYRVRLVEPGHDAPSTTVRTFVGTAKLSHDDGPGAQAGMVAPVGVAVDEAKNVIYVSDTGNATIRLVTP